MGKYKQNDSFELALLYEGHFRGNLRNEFHFTDIHGMQWVMCKVRDNQNGPYT